MGRLEEGAEAEIAVIDLRESFRIDSRDFASMGRSTPFEGRLVDGRVKMTLHKGKIVYKALDKA